MPPILDATVSDFGAYEPSIFAAAAPRYWVALAAAVVCAIAVLLGGCATPRHAWSPTLQSHADACTNTGGLPLVQVHRGEASVICLPGAKP